MDGTNISSAGRAGGVLGSLGGSLALGGLGVYAFVVPDGSIAWSLSFVVAFIAAVLGFLAPLVVFLYVGSASRFRSVYRLCGYLLSVVSIFVLALASTRLLPMVDIDTPLAALVLFDAFIGGVFGGILGSRMATRFDARRERDEL